MVRRKTAVFLAAIAFAFPVLVAPSAAASQDGRAAERKISETEIVVEDFTLAGEFVGRTSHVVEMDPDGDEEVALLASGSKNIAAPSARAGCRSIYGTTKFGVLWTFYEVKNSTYFCYNKSTKKVSSAAANRSILQNDGYSDISGLSSSKAYYNYNGWGANSGYKNKRTWKVLRNFDGAGTTTYYPRVDVYVHGDGSGYVSWTSD